MTYRSVSRYARKINGIFTKFTGFLMFLFFNQLSLWVLWIASCIRSRPTQLQLYSRWPSPPPLRPLRLVIMSYKLVKNRKISAGARILTPGCSGSHISCLKPGSLKVQIESDSLFENLLALIWFQTKRVQFIRCQTRIALTNENSFKADGIRLASFDDRPKYSVTSISFRCARFLNKRERSLFNVTRKLKAVTVLR